MANSPQPSTQLSPRRPLLDKLLLAIAGLGFIGFADSAYLTADHYLSLPLPCSLLHGCDVVLHSVYSSIGPVPLAGLGVLFYLAVMFLSLYLYTAEALYRRLVYALAAFGAAGFIMSVIFESIQIFLIHALCQYCALSALCSMIIFVLAIWFVRASRVDVA